ncbi:hypothetical protein EVAR_14700_1 [Eumeta japonica]|uniref:Uncharacterized protein n=1 Tax=Eumeta variegata TaxID=151549 RepID=A0A4C1U2B3_EUMVA|nr:hypothetical protein EVAR_14700_1 [Eumeta japonica]
MNTRDSRGVINALSVSWEEIGYLMEEEWEEGCWRGGYGVMEMKIRSQNGKFRHPSVHPPVRISQAFY